MTLFYVGSVVNPVGHLRGLPVSLVNEDRGTTVGSRQVSFGRELQSGLLTSHSLTTLLSVTTEPLASAKHRMDHNGAYVTLVIPSNFTTSLLALTGAQQPAGVAAARLPRVDLLTNRRAGSVGVQLANGVFEPAIARASHQLGKELLASPLLQVHTPATVAVLADPISVVAVEYRPLPPHSALALSAFYIALLTLMCGFIAATIINTTVDAATGYATTDLGPRWQQRAPLPINRWQTLVTKWVMALPITGLLTGLMLIVAVGVLRMDAPAVGLLWLFAWLAAASVAAGTLVLFATLGSQGQLIALLLFVYLGLASAGGTVPIEALPGPLRAVSEVEPLRQILSGTRAILYFDSAGDAGLTRGFITASAGLIFWLAVGAAVVRWYDRKGFHRIRPDVLAFVQQAVTTYRNQPQGQPGSVEADAAPQQREP
jgi:YhgE/Pip-like protein